MLTWVLVATVLVLMFTPLVRAAVDQRLALARAQREVTERTARIEALDSELQRWEDPAYVRKQARERLMFVNPGDTQYIVLDDPNVPMDNEPRADVAKPQAPGDGTETDGSESATASSTSSSDADSGATGSSSSTSSKTSAGTSSRSSGSSSSDADSGSSSSGPGSSSSSESSSTGTGGDSSESDDDSDD